MRTSTFWAAAMANLGLQVKLPQDHPVVTVITKKGRRSIENAEQIADRLRERFPEAEVALVDGNSLNTVPLKTRVRALFMPRGMSQFCVTNVGLAVSSHLGDNAACSASSDLVRNPFSDSAHCQRPPISGAESGELTGSLRLSAGTTSAAVCIFMRL